MGKGDRTADERRRLRQQYLVIHWGSAGRPPSCDAARAAVIILPQETYGYPLCRVAC